NCPTTFIARPTRSLAHGPHGRPPMRSVSSPSLRRIVRGDQIPIGFSIPRFPPLEVFRRRPPEYRAITVSGRHPKTFTKAAVAPFAHALNWLCARPGGRIAATDAELGRRWGRPRQRVGRRLKRVYKDSPSSGAATL